MSGDNCDLNEVSELTLIRYIKESIDVYAEMMSEGVLEEYKAKKKNTQEEYESLLIKLEGEVRSHIGIENMLKIESENMQCEMEEMERENKKLKKMIEKKNSDEEVEKLKNEIENYKQLLASYEEQNLKLSNIEKKLKNQIIKLNQESKNNEQNYIDTINKLNTKINSLEDKLKSYTITSLTNTKKSSTPITNSIDEKKHKKVIHSSRSTSSLNNIEKFLQQKIITKTNTTNRKNLSRETNHQNESGSYIIHNESAVISSTKKEFKKIITKNELAHNKKKGHNRQRSLEEVARFLRNKNSNLIKEMLFNNTHNSTMKKKGDSGRGKKAHFELVNNINIYTNTLKQDNHNVYVKASSMGSSNSSNSEKGNFNFVKVHKNRMRSKSSRK